MTQILLSTILTLAVLLTGFNTVSFDQTKYLSKEYWLKSDKLGTFTTLATSDQLSAFPTTYNANLAKTIEVGTTSIPTITTLSGLTTALSLATVGNITAGRWAGNAIQSNFGGLGTTSMSQYRVVLGNGTSSTTVATSTGSAGMLLTSGGIDQPPFWQAASFDTSINYSLSGLWRFDKPVNASSTLSVAQKLNVSTSTPDQTVNLAVSGGALISGTTTVGGLIATTSLIVNGNASTTNLTISGNQIGGSMTYTGSSTVFSASAPFGDIFGTIPSNANWGIINVTITDAGTIQGQVMFSRTGITSVVFGHATWAGLASPDGLYTFAWSGNNFTINESSDEGADSSVNGTIYWYQ